MPGTRPGARHRLFWAAAGELGEAIAAVLVVAELVEARAGGREQDGVARPRGRAAAATAALERPAAAKRAPAAVSAAARASAAAPIR